MKHYYIFKGDDLIYEFKTDPNLIPDFVKGHVAKLQWGDTLYDIGRLECFNEEGFAVYLILIGG